jgi:hypothetical protein
MDTFFAVVEDVVEAPSVPAVQIALAQLAQVVDALAAAQSR